MPPIGPTKRRELIACRRRLGFVGPLSGGKHQFMVRGVLRLRIPNPHVGDIGPELLRRILQQAGIEPADWTEL